MKTKLLYLIFFLAQIIGAQDIKDLFSKLSTDQYEELIREGAVSYRPKNPEDLKLLPKLSFIDTYIDQFEDIDPNIMAEKLFILSEATIDEKGFLYLLNSLNQVSRLDEVEYINPDHVAKDGSQGKWHPIFDASYRVFSRKENEPVDDFIFQARPEKIEAIVYQELPPVGPMFSNYSYMSGENHLLVVTENQTSLKVGVFPVINKGNFYSVLIIYQLEDYLIFYGIGGVKVFNPFNVLKGKVEPFYYRIEGLFQWYYDNYLVNLKSSSKS